MKLKISTVILMLLLALPVMAQDGDSVNPAELEFSGTPDAICEQATPAIEPETREYASAENVLEAGIDYRAILCTSAGAIYVDLYENFTPATVNNFVFLAEANYYNNTIFHRVMENFMAQGGDPTGTGAGGPGYRFEDEIVGFLAFDRAGLLAMANSGPATNGSQFFITTVETPWLNGAHTIFGDVLEGQAETVDNINLRDPQAGGDATTLDAVVIIRDPELVDSTFEENVEIATAEDFVTGIETTLAGQLPDDITFDGSQELTTDEVVAIAPDELQADYAVFLEENGHDYRVSALLDNATCNETYFFASLSYSVDAFASADAAASALDSQFLADYYETVGYTAYEGNAEAPYNAYLTEIEACDTTLQVVSMDLLRGRYLVNISTIFLVDGNDTDALIDFTLNTIPGLFETGLADAYRSELR
ncbi:MAG: peptidylprolyl isomerase [Chloroflexota bacterium]